MVVKTRFHSHSSYIIIITLLRINILYGARNLTVYVTDRPTDRQ